jgi:hypothetical protein
MLVVLQAPWLAQPRDIVRPRAKWGRVYPLEWLVFIMFSISPTVHDDRLNAAGAPPLRVLVAELLRRESVDVAVQQ